jgi:hypothetical protein
MNEEKSTNEKANIVHVSRSLEPVGQVISPELELKNKRSKEMYPYLNLSPGEYVVKVAKRHPVGLALPALTSLIVAVMGIGLTAYSQTIIDNFNQAISIEIPTAILIMVSLVLVVGSVLGLIISYFVFTNNRLFLTNESIIQRIQISLFSKQEQAVSLSSVEDSSYKKDNIVEYFFDYGDIRLSTVGDETTYRLSYVSKPKEYMAVLDNAVESFKNGRPVSDSVD